MSTSWTQTSSPSSPKAELGSVTPRWTWLGRVPFGETVTLQEGLRGALREDRGPETLLLLEHDPIITLGRSAVVANVLHSESWLADRGIGVHRASRGGDVTYHGPGQLVGYPIVRLRSGIRAHIEGMAAALAEVLRELGVAARYRSDAPGLWVEVPQNEKTHEKSHETGHRTEHEAPNQTASEAKICAFGVHVRSRITMHGFALNLDPDLDAFRLIVPCGLTGSRVTSVARLCGSAPTPAALSARVAAALAAHMKIPFARADTLSELHYSPGAIE
jgi:lipoyl(octanoyl) transferase